MPARHGHTGFSLNRHYDYVAFTLEPSPENWRMLNASLDYFDIMCLSINTRGFKDVTYFLMNNFATARCFIVRPK